jgi:hypothetical protein
LAGLVQHGITPSSEPVLEVRFLGADGGGVAVPVAMVVSAGSVSRVPRIDSMIVSNEK